MEEKKEKIYYLVFFLFFFPTLFQLFYLSFLIRVPFEVKELNYRFFFIILTLIIFSSTGLISLFAAFRKSKFCYNFIIQNLLYSGIFCVTGVHNYLNKTQEIEISKNDLIALFFLFVYTLIILISLFHPKLVHIAKQTKGGFFKLNLQIPFLFALIVLFFYLIDFNEFNFLLYTEKQIKIESFYPKEANIWAMFDNNLDTSACLNLSNYRDININFYEYNDLSKIQIYNGISIHDYNKYKDYSRIKSFYIDRSEIFLEDKMQMQEFVFEGYGLLGVENIHLLIDAVYQGKSFQTLCITEFIFYASKDRILYSWK